MNGININVEAGDVYGFIGPNGAGKSTAIRILLGIIRATNGDAQIFSKNAWTDAIEIHKRVAYVPGDVNLWSNLTGGEVIDFFTRLRRNGGISRKKELIERFELDPYKKCRTYSKGNRQKVALIAAFASDADLYTLDEPTSGLDPLMERVFQDYVSAIKKDGRTVFLSSHILHEVEQLCDKVSIIKEGRIIESGTITKLRHLTRTNITVETQKNIIGLDAFPYISDIKQAGGQTFFTVDSGKLNDAIKHITQFGIVKLQSAPPTLEELFMSHYQNFGGK